MKATIVTYSLENTTAYQRTLIHRMLYGYKDHSNKNNYKYERKGILDSLLSLRIIRGIIIPEKEKREIVSLLKKNGVKVKTIPINIKKALLGS